MCRSTADISGSMDISKNREVLPTNVVPRHYNVTLEPDFKKFVFHGEGKNIYKRDLQTCADLSVQ